MIQRLLIKRYQLSAAISGLTYTDKLVIRRLLIQEQGIHSEPGDVSLSVKLVCLIDSSTPLVYLGGEPVNQIRVGLCAHPIVTKLQDLESVEFVEILIILELVPVKLHIPTPLGPQPKSVRQSLWSKAHPSWRSIRWRRHTDS